MDAISLKHNDAFPTININDECVLDLPEEGLITFRYKRGSIVARSATKKEKASASTTLELTKICDYEEADPEEIEEKEEYRDSPIDKLFSKALDEKPEDE